MLQLAAATWKISWQAALAKLRSQGIELLPTAESFEAWEQNLEKMSRFDRFVAEAQQQTQHSTQTLKLIQELGWQCRSLLSENHDEAIKMFGASTAKEVQTLFRPNSKHRSLLGFGSRLFVGAKWDDVLIVPYYDLPGRVAALLVIGRNADPKQDYVFQRVVYKTIVGEQQSKRGGYCEAGLASHPGVVDAFHEWGRQVLAVRDPVEAIAWQCKHLERSPRPLPLVSWQSRLEPRLSQLIHETRYAWTCFGKGRVVFWMPKVSTTTLAQAIRAGGKIAVGTAVREFEAPGDRCHRALKHAKYWWEYLEHACREWKDHKLENLFLELEHHGVTRDEALEKCSLEARERIAGLMKDVRFSPVAQWGTHIIFEEDDCWYRDHWQRKEKPELAVDAVVKIATIIHKPTTGEIFYRGEVRYKGESFSFCEPKEVLEKEGFEWLQIFLLLKQRGLLRYKKHMKLDLATIAIEMYKPRFVSGLDQIGWSASQGRFLFPQFAIAADGEVTPQEPALFVGEMPARHLEPPAGFGRDELAALFTPESAALWGVVIAFLENVTAGLFHRSAPSIGLHRSGAVECGREFAAALGCLQRKLSSVDDFEEIKTLMKRYAWPVWVTLASRGRRRREVLAQSWLREESDVQYNCLVELDQWRAWTQRISGGWRVITAERSPRFTPAVKQTLQAIVTGYLTQLTRRGSNLPDAPTQIEAIAEDLIAFLNIESGERALVNAGLKSIGGCSPEDGAAAFSDLLSEIIWSGEVEYVQSAHADYTRAAIIETSEGVYLSRLVLERMLTAQFAATPTHGRITTILADTGVLVRATDEGWLFATDWWRENFRAYSAQRSGLLRVSG